MQYLQISSRDTRNISSKMKYFQKAYYIGFPDILNFYSSTNRIKNLLYPRVPKYRYSYELSYMKVHKSTYIQVLQDIINSLFCLWKNKNLIYQESLYNRLSRNISSQMKYFLYLQMKSRDTAFYKVKCVIIIYQFLVKGIINSNNISPYLQGLIECSCNEHSYKFQV